MFKSINTKLFLVFASIMLAFIAVGLLINTLFLEQFYIYQNRRLFEVVNRQVQQSLKSEPAVIINLIEQLDRTEGISITISDSKSQIIYNSYSQKLTPNFKLPKEIDEILKRETTKNPIYTTTTKTSDQSLKLVYITRQSNGDLIVLSKPLKGIEESANISNQFYLSVGLIMLLLGSFLMYRFAQQITKPVVKMSNIALQIAGLDFSTRMDVTTHDELGTLATSINTISEQLEVSINQLKQDIALEKQLTRDLSHELKTPISVIKGYAEGLLYGVADDPIKVNRYCQTINAECDRMNHMISQLLDYSRLEGKQRPLKMVELKMGELIHSICERLQPLINDQQLTLSIIGEPFTIIGDYELMERAITNLITNAIKYNQPQGSIIIKLSKVNNTPQLTIFNTTQPIPEADINHLFELFYKVDKARSRTDGYGIGLSIVKAIINNHHGTITVNNVPAGVEFKIVFNI